MTSKRWGWYIFLFFSPRLECLSSIHYIILISRLKNDSLQLRHLTQVVLNGPVLLIEPTNLAWQRIKVIMIIIHMECNPWGPHSKDKENLWRRQSIFGINTISPLFKLSHNASLKKGQLCDSLVWLPIFPNKFWCNIQLGHKMKPNFGAILRPRVKFLWKMFPLKTQVIK